MLAASLAVVDVFVSVFELEASWLLLSEDEAPDDEDAASAFSASDSE